VRQVKVKAFGVSVGTPPPDAVAEARAAATANPYASARRVPLEKFLTVPSRPKDQATAAPTALLAVGAAADDRREGREPDPMHSELGAGGDWRCGYCNNVNRARYKQTERCNLRCVKWELAGG